MNNDMNVTDKIWDEHHEKLRAFIMKRINDHSAADDILQDVFLKIHTRIDTLKEEERLESWLYQIARNTIIDYYRAKRPSEELPDWVSQPETYQSEQARQELETCLSRMIMRLPEGYRDALVLSGLEGKKQEEISRELGISLSGAKSRIRRGHLLLKKEMSKCCRYEYARTGQVVDYEKIDEDGC